MNFEVIKSKAIRTLNKAVLKTKKYSPEILVGAGIVGMVSAGVMACVSTLKLNSVIEDHKSRLDVVDMETKAEEEITKEKAKVYAKTGLNLVALYGPSVALAGASIAAIVGSHNILSNRNAALAAAYATIDATLKDYRSRVVERFGSEIDKELRYNIKKQEVDELVTDENGNEKVEKKMISIAEGPTYASDYARYYDEYCNGWTKDPEHNLMFLKRLQADFTDRLKAKGVVYLNEVYHALGIPETKAGHVVGWLYDEDEPIGDNYIDFGIYDLYREGCRDFVNGRERSILLDFNVDGNVWELM